MLETAPTDGALVESAPDQVVIRFSEAVALIEAQVLDAAGKGAVPGDAASARGPTVRIALPAALAEGSYIASYRVISTDSHPVGGSIVFSVGKVSSHMAASLGTADDRGWKAAMAAINAVLYCSILGGAGAVLYLLLLRPPGAVLPANARIASAFAAAGSLAALLALGINGGLMLGGPVSRLADVDTWKLGWASSYGTTAVTAMLGLALVAATLQQQRPALRFLGYVGAFAALTCFALSGHVITAGPLADCSRPHRAHGGSRLLDRCAGTAQSVIDPAGRRGGVARPALLADRRGSGSRPGVLRPRDRRPAGRERGVWPIQPTASSFLSSLPWWPGSFRWPLPTRFD